MDNHVQGVAPSQLLNEAQDQGNHNLVERDGIPEDAGARCGTHSSHETISSLTSESVEKSPPLVHNNVELTLMENNVHEVEEANVFSAPENLVTCNTRRQRKNNCRKVCESHSSSIRQETDISFSVVHDRVRSTSDHLDEHVPCVENNCQKRRKICESPAVTSDSIKGETSTLLPDVHDSVQNACAKHSVEELLHGGSKQLDPETQNVESCTLIQTDTATLLKEDSPGASPKDKTGDVCKMSSVENVDKQSERTMEDTVPSAAEDCACKAEISPANGEVALLPQERPLSLNLAKKLLVLDVNGLLADIVFLDGPCERTPDTVISSKAVFTRPFYKDFLEFCFMHFNVGIWTSRTKKNVDLILDFMMGESRNKLLFCWDQSHCTDSGFSTVEDRKKPLIIKELKKLWEKADPHLPWERGAFNESNTLLLDDTPHKALCNPPHTAIFPESFRYKNVKDASLSPEGELRSYLKGVAEAENVQKYVQENPFGKRPITERNISWRYYQKVIAACSSSSDAAPNRYASYHSKASSSEAAPYRYPSYHWNANHPPPSSDIHPRRYENHHWQANHCSSPLENAPYGRRSDHQMSDHSFSSEAAPCRHRIFHWRADNSSLSEAPPYRRGIFGSETYIPSSSSEATARRYGSYLPQVTDCSSSAQTIPNRHWTTTHHMGSFEAIADRRGSYHWRANHQSSSSEAIPDRHGSCHWRATRSSSSSGSGFNGHGGYHREGNYLSSSGEAIPYPSRSYHWRVNNSTPSSSVSTPYRPGGYHQDANR